MSAPGRGAHRTTMPWRNPYPLIVLALLICVAVLTVPAPLANDIRYEIGTHAVSQFGVAQTFSHRPLMHRFIMELFFAPSYALSSDRIGFEIVMRVLAIVFSGLAGAALWYGMRRRLPRLASPISVAAVAGLLLPSSGVAWEPDWVAVVLTVAGVGLCFLPRPIGPIAGGIVFAVAAVLKFVTLPIALIGLLAVLLLEERPWLGTWPRTLREVPDALRRLDRTDLLLRPVIIATLAAIVTGIVWLILLVTVWPWEITWLLDASKMQPVRPLGPKTALSFELLGNSMIMWPAIALVPAALVGATRIEKAVVIGSLVLAWIPMQLQNQFFPYHLAAFPVIGSVALVLGVRRGGRWLAAYALIAGLGSVVALTMISPPVRIAWVWAFIAAWVLYAAGGVLLQRRLVRARSAPANRRLSALATLLGVLLLIPVSLPAAKWSFTMDPSRYFSTNYSLDVNKSLLSSGAAISSRIGPDTPVLYFGFGDLVYAVGNPTWCKFPTNVFVQRGQWEKPILPTATYADNLKCLDDPRNKYLVWDSDYVTEWRQPPAVMAIVERNFDCSEAFQYGLMTVCPRR
ncbi:MAG: hypothetical protein L0G99_07000 [Propionibacteriales bacterium]|nr:hypothetical protein [Propionibacteriales bacterium]